VPSVCTLFSRTKSNSKRDEAQEMYRPRQDRKHAVSICIPGISQCVGTGGTEPGHLGEFRPQKLKNRPHLHACTIIHPNCLNMEIFNDSRCTLCTYSHRQFENRRFSGYYFRLSLAHCRISFLKSKNGARQSYTGGKA